MCGQLFSQYLSKHLKSGMLHDPQIKQLYLISNFNFMCLRESVISVLRSEKFKFLFLMGPFSLYFFQLIWNGSL